MVVSVYDVFCVGVSEVDCVVIGLEWDKIMCWVVFVESAYANDESVL